MLLATDLDGTFLDGDPEARLRLYQLITRHPNIQLAFVTGRGLEAVLPLLADPTLPLPDYIICDVGATIVDHQRQAIQPIQSEIEQGWPGEQVVAKALEHIPGIVRQDKPQERRCSYYCESSAITADLRDVALELDCELQYSAELYLDILPKGVNKGSTLRRLVEHLGQDPEEVLVAGDSLNDLTMYQLGYKSVCVGQSEPGLLDATRTISRVLHAERAGAGGILEAMAHFGFMGEKAVAALAPPPQKAGTAELVMVYHRLPYEEVVENGELKRRRPKSPNGIIPTLLNFFGNGIDGSWIAWAVHNDAHGKFITHTAVDAERFPNLTAARVRLTQEQVDIFYKRFSKEAFWPTLHTFWERATFREDDWLVFLEVNKLFAQAAAAEAAENAVVWIHDYNLWMVPAFLRELRPDVRIAFFHHTYFPSADVFNVLPWRRQIVGSLLQCDYVGFHIPRQAENFVDVVRGAVPVEVVETVPCAPRFLTYGCAVGLDQMTTCIKVHGNREVRLGAHPVGLDVDRIRSILELDATKKLMADLRQALTGVRLILSVERLDYTKGTLEKLLAFENLLQEHPELRRKVTLMTVCVPAAREMTIYDELQTQIEQAVGRINGRFSQLGWTPVQFFFRSLPFEEVVAYYAMADVMWITTLRDGLNLVAKEYVAVQGLTTGRGVLVLSEFCGAAAEMKGALLTNPHDPADLVAMIYHGIVMGRAEAEDRLRSLFGIVEHYDLKRWGEDYLAAVGGVGSGDPTPMLAAS